MFKMSSTTFVSLKKCTSCVLCKRSFEIILVCRHVGVCCPDDIALSGVAGSQIILDLPGGGEDYEKNDNTTGELYC